MRPLLVGNRQMSGCGDEVAELAATDRAAGESAGGEASIDLPFMLLTVAAVKVSTLSIACHDCHQRAGVALARRQLLLRCSEAPGPELPSSGIVSVASSLARRASTSPGKLTPRCT